MSRSVFSCLGLALWVGLGYANLIRNGGFEEPFAGTWDTLAEGGGFWRLERSDTLGSGTGFAAKAYKYLDEYASISQTIDVPGPNLTFSFDGRFRVGGGSPSCWPAAAVVLGYLNSAGARMGNTKFYQHRFCTWTDSDTVHLINVGPVQGWQHYSLDVYREIVTYLRGVNPGEVRKVKVELFAYNSGG